MGKNIFSKMDWEYCYNCRSSFHRNELCDGFFGFPMCQSCVKGVIAKSAPPSSCAKKKAKVGFREMKSIHRENILRCKRIRK